MSVKFTKHISRREREQRDEIENTPVWMTEEDLYEIRNALIWEEAFPDGDPDIEEGER